MYKVVGTNVSLNWTPRERARCQRHTSRHSVGWCYHQRDQCRSVQTRVNQDGNQGSTRKTWGFFPSFKRPQTEEYEDVSVQDALTQDEPTSEDLSDEPELRGMQPLQQASDESAMLGSQQPLSAATDRLASESAVADESNSVASDPTLAFDLEVEEPTEFEYTAGAATSGLEAAVPAMTLTASLGPAVSPQQLEDHWGSPVNGLVTAAALLMAIRVAREQADAERYDVRLLQMRQQESRVQTQELREKRRQYLEQERLAKEAEAARRLDDVRRRQNEDEAQRAERERRERMQAVKEAELFRQQQEAARREFMEKEKLMEAEIAKRAEIEKQLLEESERRKREEAERLRAEAEEARKREVEERARREEEAAQQLEQQQLARQEASRQLKALCTNYTVKVEGDVSGRPAPRHAVTSGQVPRAAYLQADLRMRCPPTIASTAETLNFATLTDVADEAEQAAGNVSKAALERYVAEQPQLGAAMDRLELEQLKRMAALKAALLGRDELVRVCTAVAEAPSSSGTPADVQAAFEAVTVFSVLPPGHPKRYDALLMSAAREVTAGHLDTAVGLVGEVLEDAQAAMRPGLEAYQQESDWLACVCVYAHLLDRAPTESGVPSSNMLSLARYQLDAATKAAPRDALTPLSRLVSAVLGDDHPAARIMADLADRNMSYAKKEQQRIKRRQLQAELSARMLELSEPGPDAVRAASTQRRENLTPAPERVWALRNVAGNLMRFGNSENSGQAASMLRQALSLSEQHYGANHPGVLAVLLDYCEALAPMQQGQVELVSSYQRVITIITAIVDRYLAQRDTLSAVVLLEGSVRALEGAFRGTDEGYERLVRMAGQLAGNLSAPELKLVQNKRAAKAPVLRQLASAFTEKLGAYNVPGRTSMLEQWNKGLPLTPLR